MVSKDTLNYRCTCAVCTHNNVIIRLLVTSKINANISTQTSQ